MGTVQLIDRIHMIDLHDLNMPGRTGSYVILEESLTIIETSASPSIPFLLDGLKELKLKPEDIAYIIVTHIHLDHAGGVGLLLETCPNAKVIVHPKGYRHLADPSRLIAGAKAVYGDKFERLFEPILPVPEDRLIQKKDGEQLTIGKNCTLTFYDTPGHANHHFSIFDPISNGIFTGDTVGIYYHMLQDQGLEFYLPSTSPNQYNPDAMLASIARIEKLNVDRIFFGHFGMSVRPEEVFRQIREWTPMFIEAGENAVKNNKNETLEELTKLTYNNLLSAVRGYLNKHHVPKEHSVYEVLGVDLKVSAMGLVDRLLKKAEKG
jgi:glyoxylase-like metal-dependent hydrolase (beta-lactamase superfamily II)